MPSLTIFGLLRGGISHSSASSSRERFLSFAYYQRLFSDHFHQLGSLLAQLLDPVCSRSPNRITRHPPLASLQELLGPAIIDGPGNTLPLAQLGYAVLAAKANQHNPDHVLCRSSASRCPADILQNQFRGLIGAWALILIACRCSRRRDHIPPSTKLPTCPIGADGKHYLPFG